MSFIPPPINTSMMDGDQLSMVWRRWFHDLYITVDFVGQDVSPSSSPSFVGLTLTGLASSRLVQLNGTKDAASVVDLSTYITGSTDDGDGTVTIDHGLVSGLSDDDHTQYHTSARAGVWLAANHETTYAHADIATNSTHRTTTTGNPHQVASADLVAAGTPQSGTYTFGGGGTGDVASMTFSNGILTAVTTVP